MKKAACSSATLDAVGLPIAGQQAASDSAFEVATIRTSTHGECRRRLQLNRAAADRHKCAPAALIGRQTCRLQIPRTGLLGPVDSTSKPRPKANAVDSKKSDAAHTLADEFKLTLNTKRASFRLVDDGRSEADRVSFAEQRGCAREAVSFDEWAGVGRRRHATRGFFGFSRDGLPRGRGGSLSGPALARSGSGWCEGPRSVKDRPASPAFEADLTSWPSSLPRRRRPACRTPSAVNPSSRSLRCCRNSSD